MRIEAYTQEIQMISYNSNANELYLKQIFFQIRLLQLLT